MYVLIATREEFRAFYMSSVYEIFCGVRSKKQNPQNIVAHV